MPFAVARGDTRPTRGHAGYATLADHMFDLRTHSGASDSVHVGGPQNVRRGLRTRDSLDVQLGSDMRGDHLGIGVFVANARRRRGHGAELGRLHHVQRAIVALNTDVGSFVE